MGYPMATPAQNNGKATAALVCGILSIVLCGIFTGIPALILGGQAVKEIDASGGQQGGRSQATIGRILGIISVVLTLISIVIFILLFAFADDTNTTTDFGLR